MWRSKFWFIHTNKIKYSSICLVFHAPRAQIVFSPRGFNQGIFHKAGYYQIVIPTSEICSLLNVLSSYHGQLHLNAKQHGSRLNVWWVICFLKCILRKSFLPPIFQQGGIPIFVPTMKKTFNTCQGLQRDCTPITA